MDAEGIIKRTLQKAAKVTSYHALLEIITNQGESAVVFMQGLAQAQEVELMDVEKTEVGIYYVLKVAPQSPAQRHAREIVWLDKKSFLPLQIHIFGFSNQPQQRIQFNDIKLNLKLEDEMFKM